jgi:hypothetical protein
MGHTVPTATTNRARFFGLVVLVIGVAAAIVLWLLSSKRYDDAVADLAPAPVGCDTTLVFDRTGTYTFFVETTGAVGEIDGDCSADDRDYDFDGEEAPRVELTLVDDAGDEVDLDRASGPSYSRGGASGSGVRTVDIEDTGAYVLRVDSEEDEVMVRVGRDPSSGVTPMRVGAGALLVAGLVGGGIGLLRGRRRDQDEAFELGGVERWPPVTGRPLTPPTAPPYANPPTPPPYTAAPAWPAPDVAGSPRPPRGEEGRLPPPTAPPR